MTDTLPVALPIWLAPPLAWWIQPVLVTVDVEVCEGTLLLGIAAKPKLLAPAGTGAG